MELAAALTELAYAKDWIPSSRAWYASRLGAFVTWARDHGVTELESLNAPLIRRYLDERRSAPSKTGQPLDSYTLHGHLRAIRALLNWAVAEGLIDANLPKRVALPKREQKVLAVLSDEQISRLYRAAQSTDTPARDTALLSLLLDTGCRAAELTGLRLEDVTFTPDAAWLLIRGKGRKQREVALGRRARADLHRYIVRARLRPEPREKPTTSGSTKYAIDLLLALEGSVRFGAISASISHRWPNKRYLQTQNRPLWLNWRQKLQFL
jgi:site-specific recombinase XerD